MMLSDIIETLEKYNPNARVPLGFGEPHSYRGWYDQLAFEPVGDTTVGKMLASAKSADGATYEGYKGGKYTMTGYTDCHLAKWGESGETIGEVLLHLMLQNCGENAKEMATPSQPTENGHGN